MYSQAKRLTGSYFNFIRKLGLGLSEASIILCVNICLPNTTIQFYHFYLDFERIESLKLWKSFFQNSFGLTRKKSVIMLLYILLYIIIKNNFNFRPAWQATLPLDLRCEDQDIFFMTSIPLIDPGPEKWPTYTIDEWKKGFMSPSPVSPHLCRVDRSTPAAQTHFWPIGPSIIGDRTAAP